MKNNTTLMEFPCDFNIKIIGTNSDTFASDVLNIACKHFPETKDTSIRSQPSQQGNFLSITLTVYVPNQAALDSLYIELTGHPDIKMVL
jgi:putative lipoic acid-binding regulatory protein